jgi:hypothetical protein
VLLGTIATQNHNTVLICFQELLVEEVLPLLVEKFPLAVSVKGISCSFITQMFNQKVLEQVQ